MSSSTRKLSIQSAALGLGILFLAAASVLQSFQPQRKYANNDPQNFPIHGLVSHGHHEFAWTIVAIQGLAATVNAWTTQSNSQKNPQVSKLMLEKFEESLETLPTLAKQSLGMREIFLFPVSFLAFELNDIERAVKVARYGAEDPRIEADLATTIAYLNYIFTADLQQAAQDFERLYVTFPSVAWLERIVTSLKAGVDPFAKPGRDRSRMCRMLVRAFPLARSKLIQRGTCAETMLSNEVPE